MLGVVIVRYERIMELKIGNPSIGDPMQEFELPATTGERMGLEQFVGRPLVVVFSASESIVPGRRTLEVLRDAQEQFRSRGVTVVVVSISPMEALQKVVAEHRFPFPMLSDPKIQTSTIYGTLRPTEASTQDASPGADAGADSKTQVRLRAIRRTILVRPSMHIAKIYDDPDPETYIAQLLKDIDELIIKEPPRRVLAQAPVLLIPNVFPADLCKRLIEVWNEEGNVDSGFMTQEGDKTVGKYDYSHKIRRDHFMKESRELEAVKKYVGARLIPRIRLAFNYEVSRFEDFRIACYDASRGGFFRPHRDNTTAGTAHRRFAMSLLLNDDYEGGALRFPEYGMNEYRPEAGSAVIFSCSLLHEAMDVTAGKRFVLLSFFYGEAEAKIREEYSKRAGLAYKA